jgi:phytoene dehydrogenase-like protein
VTSSHIDAVVVGSGPNGLAAAITLAQAGIAVTVLEASDEVGGGLKSRESSVPGIVHDVGSAVHPLAAISPFLASLPLARHGLEWCRPDVDVAHPLDGGRAGVLLRSIDDTAAGLGRDGDAWRRTFAPLVARFDELADGIFGPLLRMPRRPVTLARFGLRALRPATVLARRFRTDEARALFGGTAAHQLQPLHRPATSAGAAMLIAAGHRVGWPVPAGGAQALTDALVGVLGDLGVKVETGVRVTNVDELTGARLVLFDTSPQAVVDIVGTRLPGRVRRAFARYRHGPAAYKVDLVVEGGLPWTAAQCRRAGTVHLGGTLEEVARSEVEVHQGRMPERPFVVLAQPALSDPRRAVGDAQPIWAYAHVPRGYDGDATAAVLDQIERFAPGARDRIVDTVVTPPAALEADNANLRGGDIAGGANDLRQLLFRPRVALDPYAIGVPGMYLCSAATPPGGGVHGLCGHNAARHALHHLDTFSALGEGASPPPTAPSKRGPESWPAF